MRSSKEQRDHVNKPKRSGVLWLSMSSSFTNCFLQSYLWGVVVVWKNARISRKANNDPYEICIRFLVGWAARWLRCVCSHRDCHPRPAGRWGPLQAYAAAGGRGAVVQDDSWITLQTRALSQVVSL